MASASEKVPVPTTIPLDPGEARRPARSSSCCRYSYALLLLFVPELLDFFFHTGFSVSKSIVRGLDTPARALYFEGSPALANSTDEYLRPLIDGEQLFDIAFSVWQRVPGAARPGYPTCTSAGRIERTEQELVHTSIAFSGLKMMDKHVRSQVSFRVPLAPLRATLTGKDFDLNMSFDALHASFSLVPSSPSPLDRLVEVNTSSRFGDGLIRAWQSDNVDTLAYEDGQPCNRTLLDLALDTLSLSTPLTLRNLEVKLNVSNDFNASAATAWNKTQLASIMQEIGQDAIGNRTVTIDIGNDTATITSVNSWYIQTRHQLRMISETHLLNASEYHRSHAALVEKCGGQRLEGLIDSPDDENLMDQNCTRAYKTHGHVESVFKVTLSEEQDGDDAPTELRYAPYFDMLQNRGGPKDLLPITHYLQNSTDTPSDEDYINVTMQLSYRGVSASKAALADMMIPYNSPRTNTSEHEQRLAQDAAELTHGVFGHPWRDNQHPRRRFFLTYTDLPIPFICDALFWMYWYTLHTTAGVSTFPILVAAGAQIVERSWIAWNAVQITRKTTTGLLATIFLGIVTIAGFVTPLLQIRGAARVRISWRPIFRRLQSTHRERASARLDSRIPGRTKTLAIIALGTVLFFFSDRTKHTLVGSSLPPAPPSNMHQAAPGTAMRSLNALQRAAEHVASVAQLVLNHRQGQFAGQYKLEAALRAVHVVIVVLWQIPRVVGVVASLGFTLEDLMRIAIRVGFVWQAFTLARVPKVEDVED